MFRARFISSCRRPPNRKEHPLCTPRIDFERTTLEGPPRESCLRMAVSGQGTADFPSTLTSPQPLHAPSQERPRFLRRSTRTTPTGCCVSQAIERQKSTMPSLVVEQRICSSSLLKQTTNTPDGHLPGCGAVCVRICGSGCKVFGHLASCHPPACPPVLVASKKDDHTHSQQR